MTDEMHDSKQLVLVTGAYGFIGSCLALHLARSGNYRVMISDDLTATQKLPNLADSPFEAIIDRTRLIDALNNNEWPNLAFIIHIGARTDTTEFNTAIFDELNLNYSKAIWAICASRQIPLVYASSAATYGGGEFGYSDAHELINQLKPLNPYGDSKNDFDKWVLQQTSTPTNWYGLKFFNVYGPNEFHKARMASVIFHAFNQLKANGEVKLFRSHRNDFEDGQQLRDFVNVKDVIQVINWLIANKPQSGIYNLGTGIARSFYDLAAATAHAMDIPLKINWIDIPEDIRDKYQYFTEADMGKLIDSGYNLPFSSLEEGISDYVKNYLISGNYY